MHDALRGDMLSSLHNGRVPTENAKDSDVLNMAKAGVYKTKSLESVPPDKLKRW